MNVTSTRRVYFCRLLRLVPIIYVMPANLRAELAQEKLLLLTTFNNAMSEQKHERCVISLGDTGLLSSMVSYTHRATHRLIEYAVMEV
jgi:hypothetical protein